VYCNTRGLIEQGVLGIVIGVVIGKKLAAFNNIYITSFEKFHK